MREYIFRGQTRRFGEKVNMAGEKLPAIWVYGGVLQGSGDFSIIYGSTSPDGKFESKYPVYTDTLGQYTGLCDKNGEKIFEGDIVRCWDEHSGANWMAVVEFGNPNCTYSWGWQLRKIRGNEGNTDILLWVDMEETGAYIEVVGTIYDKEAK